MKKKLLTFLTSGTLLWPGMSCSVLANESTTKPMEERETLSQTDSETNNTNADNANLIASGTLGNSVKWQIDSNGTLTIGGGHLTNTNENFDWPWKKYDNQIKAVDGSQNLILEGKLHRAFKGLSQLESIDLTGWNMEKVTHITEMFMDCKKLTSLNISEWNTSKIVDMSCLLENCKSLTSLDISNWNTKAVTNMRSMFQGCTNLTSLDISNWDTSHVEQMTSMFQYCPNLTTLDLSKWNTSKVTNMEWMFDGCKSLTPLNIANWDTSHVTQMGWMFEDCEKLTSIDLSSWKTGNVTVMTSMFEGCTNLKSLDLSKWDLSKVTTTSSMFYGCISLNSLDISNWNTSNITNMQRMFEGCKSLMSVDLSNWQVGKVTTMLSMFEGCENLTSLDLSNWNPANIGTMHAMFKDCTSLKSLEIPNWDTPNLLNVEYMFKNCESLTFLDVSNWNASKVKYAQNIGTGCLNLEEIKYGFNDTTMISTLLNDLPQEWRWHQNDEGFYLASEIPALSKGQTATLTRATSSFEDYTLTPDLITIIIPDSGSLSKEDIQLDDYHIKLIKEGNPEIALTDKLFEITEMIDEDQPVDTLTKGGHVGQLMVKPKADSRLMDETYTINFKTVANLKDYGLNDQTITLVIDPGGSLTTDDIKLDEFDLKLTKPNSIDIPITDQGFEVTEFIVDGAEVESLDAGGIQGTLTITPIDEGFIDAAESYSVHFITKMDGSGYTLSDKLITLVIPTSGSLTAENIHLDEFDLQLENAQNSLTIAITDNKFVIEEMKVDGAPVSSLTQGGLKGTLTISSRDEAHLANLDSSYIVNFITVADIQNYTIQPDSVVLTIPTSGSLAQHDILLDDLQLVLSNADGSSTLPITQEEFNLTKITVGEKTVESLNEGGLSGTLTIELKDSTHFANVAPSYTVNFTTIADLQKYTIPNQTVTLLIPASGSLNKTDIHLDDLQLALVKEGSSDIAITDDKFDLSTISVAGKNVESLNQGGLYGTLTIQAKKNAGFTNVANYYTVRFITVADLSEYTLISEPITLVIPTNSSLGKDDIHLDPFNLQLKTQNDSDPSIPITDDTFEIEDIWVGSKTVDVLDKGGLKGTLTIAPKTTVPFANANTYTIDFITVMDLGNYTLMGDPVTLIIPTSGSLAQNEIILDALNLKLTQSDNPDIPITDDKFELTTIQVGDETVTTLEEDGLEGTLTITPKPEAGFVNAPSYIARFVTVEDINGYSIDPDSVVLTIPTSGPLTKDKIELTSLNLKLENDQNSIDITDEEFKLTKITVNGASVTTLDKGGLEGTLTIQIKQSAHFIHEAAFYNVKFTTIADVKDYTITPNSVVLTIPTSGVLEQKDIHLDDLDLALTNAEASANIAIEDATFELTTIMVDGTPVTTLDKGGLEGTLTITPKSNTGFINHEESYTVQFTTVADVKDYTITPESVILTIPTSGSLAQQDIHLDDLNLHLTNGLVNIEIKDATFELTTIMVDGAPVTTLDKGGLEGTLTIASKADAGFVQAEPYIVNFITIADLTQFTFPQTTVTLTIPVGESLTKDDIHLDEFDLKLRNMDDSITLPLNEEQFEITTIKVDDKTVDSLDKGGLKGTLTIQPKSSAHFTPENISYTVNFITVMDREGFTITPALVTLLIPANGSLNQKEIKLNDLELKLENSDSSIAINITDDQFDLTQIIVDNEPVTTLDKGGVQGTLIIQPKPEAVFAPETSYTVKFITAMNLDQYVLNGDPITLIIPPNGSLAHHEIKLNDFDLTLEHPDNSINITDDNFKVHAITVNDEIVDSLTEDGIQGMLKIKANPDANLANCAEFYAVNFITLKKDAEPTEPAEEDPKPSEPAEEDPKPSEPVEEDPKPSEPAEEDPKPSEPAEEDPKPSEPAEEDPKPSEPVEEDPKPSQPAEEDPVFEEPEPIAPVSEDPEPIVPEEPEPNTPISDPTAQPIPEPLDPTKVSEALYRFYNPSNGEHFYTPDEAERDALLKDENWNYEGEGWIVPITSQYPVYRVLDLTTGDHRYTLDKDEYDQFQNQGWIGEGIDHYSVDPNNPNIIPLFRLYNPNAHDIGANHYTTDVHERDVLISLGWRYDGVVGYGLKEKTQA